MGITPGPPAITSVTPGDGQLTVNWTAPSFTGADPITSYLVEWKQLSGVWAPHEPTYGSATATASPYTIEALQNGIVYEVRVSADNGTQGPPSLPWFKDPMGKPRQPVIANIVKGDGQLTVQWTAPDDAGASITGYRVQYRLSTTTAWTTVNASAGARSLTIPGLQTAATTRCAS